MGEARLWATSDLHVGYADNRRIVTDDLHPAGDGDWLIVAGDIAEKPADVEWTLATLAGRFAKVLWSPGNHELYTHSKDPVRLRGLDRYEHLVALCRRLGVITPEDEYPQWSGAGGPVTVAPLFLLYDYTFRQPGQADADEALAAAYGAGVVATDEFLLHPDPYPDRAAWCHARVMATEARLAALPAGTRTVLVNHWPLTRLPTRVLRHPQFAIWCGTELTAEVRRDRGGLRPPAHPAHDVRGRGAVRGGLARLPAGVAAARHPPRRAAGRAAGGRPGPGTVVTGR